ncbi:pimeloyl-ACP methyl ester carboxylesterase [Paenibacillus sp. BK033]|uniref:epoxide hydrolase family protein n=1 Tax=Paenibacillus sp. BK033 TaxID=2512133 RepID=UPI00104770E9|nr:epoxide hydrolase family protein [Paenibacillus sp. BK033]TCM99044.1 pimeloyl-ACP methyl ester carboxylesterase [Paenibacillus sp. BK033]
MNKYGFIVTIMVVLTLGNAQLANANRPQAVSEPSQADSIRSFQAHIPEAELSELRRRINETKWPDRETVKDQSQGTQLETMKELARYWAKDYDWRKFEAKLNGYPQYITNIDGLDIHFIHVRSKHKGALPIILTHGWPGSFVEMMKIIDPLSNPTAYGGKASDAFDVVIPSLPGYGFSEKPTEPGWGPDRIANAWIELMKRLGYTKYVAQGGDWGAIITDLMAVKAPEGLIGVHSNMPGTVPADIEKALHCGDSMPDGLSPEEKRAYEQLQFFNKHLGYAELMGTRPQTLTALADSPIGLAAFLLDHDEKSLKLMSDAFRGKPGGLSRDEILDDITLYWLTNTAISSARLYWENKYPFFGVKGVKIPTAVSVFPDELYEAPRSWAEQAYPKLYYYNVLDKGGHFAAWEQPALFTNELRSAFRKLR